MYVPTTRSILDPLVTRCPAPNFCPFNLDSKTMLWAMSGRYETLPILRSKFFNCVSAKSKVDPLKSGKVIDGGIRAFNFRLIFLCGFTFACGSGNCSSTVNGLIPDCMKNQQPRFSDFYLTNSIASSSDISLRSGTVTISFFFFTRGKTL